jgi:hypothetical protein
VRLSPFYPHGNIPVPGLPGSVSQSAEGIWQALKVFERADIDLGKLEIRSMKNPKRSARAHGHVLGHRLGPGGTMLLSYAEARWKIYLPAYRWVLEHKVADLVDELRQRAVYEDIALLDYNVNGNVADLSRPLSHAALIASYVEGRWPADLPRDHEA